MTAKQESPIHTIEPLSGALVILDLGVGDQPKPCVTTRPSGRGGAHADDRLGEPCGRARLVELFCLESSEVMEEVTQLLGLGLTCDRARSRFRTLLPLPLAYLSIATPWPCGGVPRSLWRRSLAIEQVPWRAARIVLLLVLRRAE